MDVVADKKNDLSLEVIFYWNISMSLSRLVLPALIEILDLGILSFSLRSSMSWSLALPFSGAAVSLALKIVSEIWVSLSFEECGVTFTLIIIKGY